MITTVKTLFAYYFSERKGFILRSLDDLWSRKVHHLGEIKLLLFVRLIISLLGVFIMTNLVFAAVEYLIFHHTFVHAGDYLLGAFLVMKFVVDLYCIFDIEHYRGKLILNT